MIRAHISSCKTVSLSRSNLSRFSAVIAFEVNAQISQIIRIEADIVQVHIQLEVTEFNLQNIGVERGFSGAVVGEACGPFFSF